MRVIAWLAVMAAACTGTTASSPPHTGDTATHTGLVVMPVVGIRGSAKVVAGSSYLGEQERFIEMRGRRGRVLSAPCLWSYTQNAAATADLSRDCPSCVFGFEAPLTLPVDEVGGVGSLCANAFDFLGGVGVGATTGTWTLGLAPAYGAVMYQYGGRPFGVLTYDYTYGPLGAGGVPNFEWTLGIYGTYY